MPIYLLTISELNMLTDQRKEQVAIEEFAELGGNVVSLRIIKKYCDESAICQLARKSHPAADG